MATPPRKPGFRPNKATSPQEPGPKPRIDLTSSKNMATPSQKPGFRPNKATSPQEPGPKPRIDLISSKNMATPPQKPVPKPKIDFKSFSNIIGGELCKSRNTFHAKNPATKQPLGDVPAANGQDVEKAVRYANIAQKKWARKTWEERQQICLLFRDVYSNYVDDLTDLLTLEIGRPKESCKREVESCAFFAGFHAQLPLPDGDGFDAGDREITVRYTPLGVVAAICPWNAPLILCFGKLFPAVVAGNSIIIKPSPYTPYTTLKMVEIAQQVFPSGVIQVLAGDASVGASLVEHPDIHKVSFTGSISTGKKILQMAAATMKRVTLELGGNDACIVLPDVDIDEVAPKVAMSAFLSSGQICVSSKRIYIHQSIYKPFLKAMIDFTSQIKVGHPDEENVIIGPIQNSMQFEKVKELFEDSKRKGYKFAVGQNTVKESIGYYINPAIIDNPPDDSRIVTEEPFGPIVPCQPWGDEKKMIARANNTKTGLGACIWGKDLKRCERIAHEMEAGSVFINSSAKPTPVAPFGGMKESGIGSEWGTSGIKAYMNEQVIHNFSGR